jgi:hypothetical protein
MKGKGQKWVAIAILIITVSLRNLSFPSWETAASRPKAEGGVQNFGGVISRTPNAASPFSPQDIS